MALVLGEPHARPSLLYNPTHMIVALILVAFSLATGVVTIALKVS